MRPENMAMKKYLAENGVDAMPKYLSTGSQKRQWRLYNLSTKWYGNTELIDKINGLGFRSHGRLLDDFSGNGGVFQVFAYFDNPKNAEFVQLAG